MSDNNHKQHVIVTDFELLASDKLYSMVEICQICRLEESDLELYMDYGIVVPESDYVHHFRQRQLDRLLRAIRLHHDLELNVAGVALAMDLLDTIDELKRNVSRLGG